MIEDQTENGISFIGDNFIQILIQFKALGLIEKSNRSRSVKDTATYWKLTKKGDDHLTKLRAIKKKAFDLASRLFREKTAMAWLVRPSMPGPRRTVQRICL